MRNPSSTVRINQARAKAAARAEEVGEEPLPRERRSPRVSRHLFLMIAQLWGAEMDARRDRRRHVRAATVN